MLEAVVGGPFSRAAPLLIGASEGPARVIVPATLHRCSAPRSPARTHGRLEPHRALASARVTACLIASTRARGRGGALPWQHQLPQAGPGRQQRAWAGRCALPTSLHCSAASDRARVTILPASRRASRRALPASRRALPASRRALPASRRALPASRRASRRASHRTLPAPCALPLQPGLRRQDRGIGAAKRSGEGAELLGPPHGPAEPPAGHRSAPPSERAVPAPGAQPAHRQSCGRARPARLRVELGVAWGASTPELPTRYEGSRCPSPQ